MTSVRQAADPAAGGAAPVCPRLAGIGISPILMLESQVAQRRAAGHDVISLSAGELACDTPQHVKRAAWQAMERGETRYTALTGSAALKRAIANKLLASHQRDFRPDEIIVSAGAKQCIFNALMASLQAGDEVILAAPYWTSYPDIIRLCGGRPVPVLGDAATGFKLTPAALQAAITGRTRWVLLNSPANPTGAVYTPQECRGLLDVLRQHPQIWLMSDEIYEPFVFDGRSAGWPAALGGDLQDRILTINGVSKAYAMTGWRIGYAAGPAPLIAAMAVVQSQSTSCASSISQAAAAAALGGPQDGVAAIRRDLQQRRDMVLAALQGSPGLHCCPPQGAFYAFVGWAQDHAGGGDPEEPDDLQFCTALLERYGVAVVSGAAFGQAGHFRLSYALGLAELTEALDRLRRGCLELKR